MSVRAEDLTLEGFPKWVVGLMSDCTIEQLVTPPASDAIFMRVSVPKAGYKRDFKVEHLANEGSVKPFLHRVRAAICRQAACTIWETRDKHGKILPA